MKEKRDLCERERDEQTMEMQSKVCEQKVNERQRKTKSKSNKK